MIKIFKSYPATIISILVGVIMLGFSLAFELDVFEKFIDLLKAIEHLEIDEIIIPLFIIMIGASIDSYNKYNEKKKLTLITETKLEYLETIIRTVQDIVGNSMNNLILFSMEAKDTGSLSEESIKELDNLIKFTSNKINALANTKEIREKQLGDKMFVIDVVDEDEKT